MANTLQTQAGLSTGGGGGGGMLQMPQTTVAAPSAQQATAGQESPPTGVMRLRGNSPRPTSDLQQVIAEFVQDVLKTPGPVSVDQLLAEATLRNIADNPTVQAFIKQKAASATEKRPMSAEAGAWASQKTSPQYMEGVPNKQFQAPAGQGLESQAVGLQAPGPTMTLFGQEQQTLPPDITTGSQLLSQGAANFPGTDFSPMASQMAGEQTRAGVANRAAIQAGIATAKLEQDALQFKKIMGYKYTTETSAMAQKLISEYDPDLLRERADNYAQDIQYKRMLLATEEEKNRDKDPTTFADDVLVGQLKEGIAAATVAKKQAADFAVYMDALRRKVGPSVAGGSDKGTKKKGDPLNLGI
jgi:hypothetical protein